jgi:dTDP-4-amino-4,6-dideoxygalactose transaminase
VDPVWHLYVVRTQHREKLKDLLNADGIGTLIHYPIPPHMQAAYSNLNIAEEELPLARLMGEQVLSLPMSPQLSLETLNARVIPRILHHASRL